MNYRDKIRKYIECPEFGNSSYGAWGSLRIDQRRNIKRLLDELDMADDYIKKLYKENQKLKEMQCIFLGTGCQNKIKEYKIQQREFIDWLGSLVVSDLGVFTEIKVCDVLSKYKEIIGGKNK